MRLHYDDRVMQTTETEGAGLLALQGAVPGYVTIADAPNIGIGVTCRVCIDQPGSADFEVCEATVDDAGILTRGTVSRSSNGGARVAFGPGTKRVMVVLSLDDLGGVMAWRGDYSDATAYVLNDAVSYNGASYYCIQAGTNQQPDTHPAYWSLVAAAGATGAAGRTVRSGSGAPAGELGVDGDFYINTDANTIYGPKAAGAWGAPVSLVGAAGADGKTVRSGAGAPSEALGVDGDWYINVSAGTIYGPKMAGAWGAPVSLVGAAGADGKTVRSGAGAPSGALGVDGDWYINVSAATIYGPKTAGAWGAPTSMVGPIGPAATDASTLSSGMLPDARLSGNVTVQGNTFNAASELVQLDGAAKLPAVDGSALTAIPDALIANTQASDTSASGLKRTATAGEAFSFGEVGYLKSDGKVWKGKANGTGTFPVVLMATGSIGADASGTWLLIGQARNDAWNWTVSSLLYLSTTAGVMTQTRPGATDDVVQVLGVCSPNADTVQFRPSLDMHTVV